MKKTMLSIIVIAILFNGCVATLANEDKTITRSTQNAKANQKAKETNIDTNELKKHP